VLITILVWSLLSLGLVSILAWRVNAARFRSIRWWMFALVSGLFWGVFAFILHWVYWDSYYRYFTPSFVQWLTPVAMLFYALVGLGIRWLALRLPGHPLVNFCTLGAVESIPEHWIGIYRMHILDIPMFEGVNATSIFIFAFFEYAIYWGVVSLLAVLLDKFWPRKTARPSSHLQD